MLSAVAGSMMAVSCLACLGQAENDVVQLNAGPHLAAGDVEIVTAIEKWALEGAASEFRSPLRPGGAFSPRNWAQPDNAARFRALDLSVPMPLRSLRGDTLSGELSFGAAAEATGLGLDIEVAPRARIEEATGGASVARAGAELRFGRNFWSGDGRGAPAWYMFVGADNEALFWDLGDRRGFDSVGVQEQVTVGDLQAGLAWSGRPGAQMSFGLVERSMEYNDIAGDRDVRSRERFAAFSYTLRR